ncbi:hypothetical protein ACLOJK_022396 [Asimina triloba]
MPKISERCSEGDSQIRGYSDVGDLAFGRKGRIIASHFTYVELYLVATEFLILQGDNLNKLFPKEGVEMLGWSINGRKELIVLPGLICFSGDLSLLAYISAFGAVASIAVVVSVICTGAESVGFHERGRLFSSSGVIPAVSIFAFCYGGHAVYPTIYASMAHKKRFGCILLLCFLLCTINYGTIAVAGYMMYGDDVKSRETLNLREKLISSRIAIYTTLVNPFAKYSLLIAPMAMAIEERCHTESKIINSLSTLAIRTLLVISTVTVAVAVPFFGDLMVFIGSFLCTVVSMVLPCLCYLKISWNRAPKSELAFVLGILAMGVLITVGGTYSSVKQIVEHL